MADQDGLSVADFLGGAPNTENGGQPVAQPDAVAFANKQIDAGKSPDDAIALTAAQFHTFDNFKFTIPKGGKHFEDAGAPSGPMSVEDFAGAPGTPPDFSSVQGSAQTDKVEQPWSEKLANLAGEWAKNKQADTAQALGNITSYFHNWSAKHEVTDGGTITPEQKAAMKALGMDVPDFPIWGPIYKMAPGERDEMDDKFQKTMGLDPKATKERLEKTTGTDLSQFDPYGKLLNDSLITHAVSQLANPELANSRRYQEVQDMVKNMDAVQHPDKYPADFVKASTAKILAYKQMNENGISGAVKQQWQDIKANPIGQAKAMAGGIASEPELMLAPEAKLGSALAGSRGAAAEAAVAEATRLAGLAGKVKDAAGAMPGAAEAAANAQKVYENVAGRATDAAHHLAAVKHVGDIVGQVGAGAAINTGSTAVDQFNQQGFVQPGTLPTAAAEGAVLGAAGHFLAGKEKPLEQELHERAQPVAPEVGPNDADKVPDVNAGKKPGEPLSPQTPINKKGVTPYYGGVDASGKIIHLSESTPDTLPVKNAKGASVDIPVKQTVAYHEAVEYPLMHLEGPMSPESITKLQQRLGKEGKLPPATIEKLKKGESLPYTNPDDPNDPGAHEIATMAENHMVRTLYNVNPKHYQEALKPHIKQVAKDAANADPSDIPVGLDTKPYDDVNQNEQLMGRGDRPAVDNVEPGVKEGTDNKQKGKIDNRLLATGVATGAGAAVGAYTSDKDHKEAGAAMGGLTGLLASTLFWGGDIGVSGERKRQGGMFVGPRATTDSPHLRARAEAMEDAGKTPEQIHLATGYHSLADGQWAHELSDKGLKLTDKMEHYSAWRKLSDLGMPLKDAIKHPALMKAYPTLADKLRVKVEKMDDIAGHYDPRTHTITLNDPNYLRELAKIEPTLGPEQVMAHEIQHAIQHYEGWPTGSSPARHAYAMEQEAQELYKSFQNTKLKLAKAELDDDMPTVKVLEKQVMQMQDALETKYHPKVIEKKAYEEYRKSAGENQSWNVQDRFNMTDQERRASYPGDTQKMPFDKQTVAYDTGYKSLAAIPKGQRGSADIDILKRLARAATFGTVGAAIGANLDSDNPVGGAIAGAGLAMLAGPMLTDFIRNPIRASRNVVGNLKQSIKVPVKENINDTISRWQEQGMRSEVEIYRVQKAIERLAPGEKSQTKITHYNDGDKSVQLTKNEMEAARIQQAFDKELGRMGMDAGVLDHLIDNHMTHLWKNDDKLKQYKELMDNTITANMNPNSRFAEARKIKSIAQGKAMGLTPVTENASKITGIYARSVLQAIRNKQLLESLKAAKDSSGNSFLVMPAKKAPINFTPINHPQLRGMAVHPTIATELRNVFYTHDLGVIQQTLGTLNMAMKRSELSFSLFHLTSLADAAMGGLPTFTHPLKTMGAIGKSIVGKSDFHKALEGKADPATQQLFDRFLASGARPQIPRGSSADVDIDNGYYAGLQHLQNYMDRVIPGTGKLSSAIAKMSHIMDHVIFANTMSGAKFAVWTHVVDKMNVAWAKEARKHPGIPAPSQIEIDRMAGGFVNNLMGAQNWLQAAQQATTKFGRAYLTALGSPKGRQISQYLLLAPDWTTSTVMSLTKAFGKGSGIGGLLNPKTVADLHRIYQIRSALLYATIGGAINYAFSGHYLWDNKDKTTIDMGNGQRMQWNKHWIEPFQLATNLRQSVINKMGALPREAIEQTFQKEYINVNGRSPDMKDPLAHFAKKFIPIPFQNMKDQNMQSMMWNLAGRNVMGHPTSGPGAAEYAAAEHERRAAAAKKAAATRQAKRNKDLYGE